MIMHVLYNKENFENPLIDLINSQVILCLERPMMS